MTVIFRDHIGCFVYIYLNDIFIYSDTLEKHELHLWIVFKLLEVADFYLEQDKYDLYAEKLNYLDHIIDQRGVHANRDKMSWIFNWRTPKSLNEVQQFVGLVKYLAQFIPDVSAYATPLTGIQRNGHSFQWREIHNCCFQITKDLACKYLILKPIDQRGTEPIWLVCNTSLYGIGALYGQGPNWKTCCPAGFMSKKLSDAQQNYRTFEHKTLTITEALLKWEDKLLEFRFTIITDHEAWEYLNTQWKLSSSQICWIDYMLRFNVEIIYTKGSENWVADCLSRYYEKEEGNRASEEEIDWANADVHLDPDGNDLSHDMWLDLRAITIEGKPSPQKSKHLVEKWKTCILEAQEMASTVEKTTREAPCTIVEENPTVIESTRTLREPLVEYRNWPEFFNTIHKGYENKPLLAKVLAQPNHFPQFIERSCLLYTKNHENKKVLCLPYTSYKGDNIIARVVDQAHRAIRHFGAQRTTDYICRLYWWPKIGHKVDKFCQTCLTCQTTKPSNQLPQGLLHSLPSTRQPWRSFAMDFVGPFPPSEGHDYLWVVLCCLTSMMVHLVPIKTTIKVSELACKFIQEVVQLHRLPETIVSRYAKFTFWCKLHWMLGARLLMSTAFHLQTDGASERTIRNVVQILWATVQPDQKDWVVKLPITEFALNSSIHI